MKNSVSKYIKERLTWKERKIFEQQELKEALKRLHNSSDKVISPRQLRKLLTIAKNQK